MLANLALGTLLISATVLIHTVGLVALLRSMLVMVHWLRLQRHDFGKTIAIMLTVFGLFFLHTIEIWLCAAAYVAIGVINGFETALYFSTVTFSTLGYGDIQAAPQWRLFASFEGIDGFLLLGWSLAYLVAASTRHGPFRTGEHF
nr:MAG: two pore domain potassium channel family protein [Hyphomicrobiales bacterium]